VDTEVLSLGLDNGLLEVDAESQDLSIVLEPLGSDLWDSIVLMGGALGHSGVRHSGTLTHGIEHFLVDGFLEALGLFHNGAVLNAQKLGFVVTRDSGIGVNVSGEHGKLPGEILRLHVLFLSYLMINKLRVSDYLLYYFYITI